MYIRLNLGKTLRVQRFFFCEKDKRKNLLRIHFVLKWGLGKKIDSKERKEIEDEREKKKEGNREGERESL